MQVVLLERIEKLGQMGDVVTVKPGYARNFLLPKQKAMRATKANLQHFENQRAQLEADNLKRREEAEQVSGKLEGLTVSLIRQAGDSGQLYGSVNTRDIAEAVTEAGVTIARSQVVLDKVIKTLGLHDVKVVLHPEVSVNIVVNTARSAEEAELQLSSGGAVSNEEAAEEREAVAEAVEEEITEEETEA
ncbi:50S ribosomal protein L9 [Kiloniella sp. EL199]|uniref:50S ribosomal protein L9 n=1 Tax=Kiloniella sp. EL199 TaxID=2107581 RepID=UPI000EA04EAD|nr:50S ribosomal protein L9 [Kiloniella sp. EL199]